jgi:hypothetical protein
MTADRMALLELIEKRADGDLIRELLAYAAERLMAAEVEGLCGAGHGERSPGRINQRNGYRERSRAALSTGHPRRPARAQDPQAQEGHLLSGLSRAAADGGARPRGRDPSSAARSIHARRDDGLKAIAGRLTSMASRPAPSTTWCRRWG